MLVYQILKSKSDDAVVTVKSGSLVSEAAKILSDCKIGTVVISQTGKDAKGILSERDIVRAIANRGASCLMDKVDTYMTAKLVTCSRNESADNVLKMMTEGDPGAVGLSMTNGVKDLKLMCDLAEKTGGPSGVVSAALAMAQAAADDGWADYDCSLVGVHAQKGKKT